jgi:hypothetical protein
MGAIVTGYALLALSSWLPPAVNTSEPALARAFAFPPGEIIRVEFLLPVENELAPIPREKK